MADGKRKRARKRKKRDSTPGGGVEDELGPEKKTEGHNEGDGGGGGGGDGGVDGGGEGDGVSGQIPPHDFDLHTPVKHNLDYVLVWCYILVYLEVTWLIYMLLRSYSRD